MTNADQGLCGTERTSGIHGGYRLVSTYDLPDSKPLGGYSGVNFGYLKSEVFHWGGGILEYTLVISNLKFFIGDVFRSKLWSSQI